MIAGVDIGTSSVKVLLFDGERIVARANKKYTENSPSGWLCAIKEAVCEVGGEYIDEVAFSSQTGTYVIDGKTVLPWSQAVGKSECEQLKSTFSRQDFLSEISMPHPEIYSYPIPRIMYILKQSRPFEICQPKDYIIKAISGNYVSDIYSWRGLANIHNGKFSEKFLNFLGISREILPTLLNPCDYSGRVTEKGQKLSGIKEGAKICVGLNDFYASLVGMGIDGAGDMFDATGTSEHLGIISDELSTETPLVSSPYFEKSVLYGVTASSGVSTNFGIELFDVGKIDLKGYTAGKDTPIFLPYLKGERAPIFDMNARGVFFGISGKTDKRDMAFSVLEGIVFSLLNIYENFDVNVKPTRMIVSGGASHDCFLNQLKADTFGTRVEIPKEKDCSAFGAVCCALCAEGNFENPILAAKSINETEMCFEPDKCINGERFELFKRIYLNLKNDFTYYGRK